MKRIIEGKRYDTETATEIASYWNHLSRSDFHYVSETLYRTKNGNWFLHGSGGALSRYSESLGNNSRGGDSKLIAFSENEAFEWLEENNKASEIETHFPDRVVDA